jgi:hypothetical protein
MWFCSAAGVGALGRAGLAGWLTIGRATESCFGSLRKLGREDVTGRRRRLGTVEGWRMGCDEVAGGEDGWYISLGRAEGDPDLFSLA